MIKVDIVMTLLLRLLAITGLMLLAGCATQAKYEQKLAKWQGKNIDQFTQHWGYPDEIQSAPQGPDKLAVYRDNSTTRFPVTTTPGYTHVATDNGKTTVTTTGPYQSGGGVYHSHCTTWVRYNPDSGKIVSTSFRGNNCVSG